jgi:hypothetical protein
MLINYVGGCQVLKERDLSQSASLGEVGGVVDVHCKLCGSVLRRLKREGFMQQKVYPIFGYYPWECPVCRKPSMVKMRYMRKRRTVQEQSSD